VVARGSPTHARAVIEERLPLGAQAVALAAVLAWGCAGQVGDPPERGVTPDAGRSLDAGPSRPPPAPSDECDNGLDDDRNGVVDDGCYCTAGTSAPCWLGDAAVRGTGTCRDGVMQCDTSVEFPSWLACEGEIGPAEERCDAAGTDEDCDGLVDEGCACAGEPMPCGSDVGACELGSRPCVDGRLGECEGALDPSAEECNAIDDDCDAIADEALARECGSSIGECRVGRSICDAGAWRACEGSVEPAPESCNAADDDCDGIVDESLSRGCGIATGACELGTETCIDGVFAGCTGAIGPRAESCNDSDDDCDGAVDEGLTMACGTDVGPCVAGTRTCSRGAWGACVTPVGPSPEVCNFADDDCDGAIDDGVCTTRVLAIDPRRPLDLLFVVDNSNSMIEEQAALAAAYPRLLTALESAPGGLPSLHVGVTSSDVGTAPYVVTGCTMPAMGDLQSAPRVPGCSAPTGAFIEDVVRPDGTRARNYSGTLAETFSCIAQLGNTGCGFEQHFEAMRRALDGSRPRNAGFVRPDAFLAVVILADEDDCSASDPALFDLAAAALGSPTFRCTEYGVTCDGATLPRAVGAYTRCEPRAASPYVRHPDEYATFLTGLKADPSRVMVAAIAGNVAPFSVRLDTFGRPELGPSCGGTAVPAVRFDALLDRFPGRSAFTSICSADLSGALGVIGTTIATAMSSVCLSFRPLDADPSTPALDPACSVDDVEAYGTPVERVMASLPACATTPAGPCFSVVESSATCAAAPRVEVQIHRRGVAPPAATRPVVRCTTP
jgi:hypothetical protein